MKADVTPLYREETMARSVTGYSAQHSLQLPEHIVQFHTWLCDTRADSNFAISIFQAQAMAWLARATGAKRVLEIGVYVGFSTMVWAHAVGPHGKVTGLEFSEEFAKIAEKGWADNGVRNCEIVLGDALTTLAALNPAEPYDLIFIDAQKTGYPEYLRTILERSLPGSVNRLLRPGGLIVADNVLRRGLVPEGATEEEPNAREVAEIPRLREFNAAMNASPRVEVFLMPLWDGVGLGRLVD